MAPVWLTTNLTLQAAEKGKPQRWTGKGGWVGAMHRRRVHRDSKKTFPPFMFAPLRGVATPRVLQTLWFTSALWSGFRCPKVRMSQHCDSGLESLGVPMSRATDFQFWVWCPFLGSKEPHQCGRANYHFDICPSVHHRSRTRDFERDNRKEMFSWNGPLKCTRDDTRN